jgi:hypothetical protein
MQAMGGEGMRRQLEGKKDEVGDERGRRDAPAMEGEENPGHAMGCFGGRIGKAEGRFSFLWKVGTWQLCDKWRGSLYPSKLHRHNSRHALCMIK